MTAAPGNSPWVVLHKVVRSLQDMQVPEPLRKMGYPEITGEDMEGILGSNAVGLFSEI